MNLAQAIEHANALAFPGFLVDDQSLTDERRKNEEAIGLLLEGADAQEAADKLRGNTCGNRPTSCADQLSRAIDKAFAVEA